MGYGGLPNFTEYDPSGHVLLDGTLGKNVQSFRTYLAPWSGQAPGAPAVAASAAPARRGRELERRHERRLLAGARRAPRRRARAGRAAPRRRAFRRRSRCRAAAPYVAVQALDASGAVLGTSHDGQGLSAGAARARRRHRLIVRALSAGLAATLGAAVLASGCAGRAGPARAPAARGAGRPALRAATLNVSAALAGARVTVSPAPGQPGRLRRHPDQLARRARAAAARRDVTVAGSRSGAHAGRLLAYSQGDGASFVPARPFAAGELVTRPRACCAKAASAIPFAWSFTVAVPDDPGPRA